MAAAALDQTVLESKDKDTLLEMAKALGVKANSRLKKSDIIDKILHTTGPSSEPAPRAEAADRPAAAADQQPAAPRAERKVDRAPQQSAPAPAADGVVLGDDGEPLADWEIALREQGVDTSVSGVASPGVESKQGGDSRDDAGHRNRNRNSSDANREGNRGDGGAQRGSGDTRSDGGSNNRDGGCPPQVGRPSQPEHESNVSSPGFRWKGFEK